MSSPIDLQPGDKVIALAAMTQTVAIVAGFIIGPVCAYITTTRILYVIFGIIIGCAVGYLTGTFSGRLLFPASATEVVVIKAGVPALAKAFTGCISATLLAAVFIAGLSTFLVKDGFAISFGISAIIAVVVGALWAMLVSLL